MSSFMFVVGLLALLQVSATWGKVNPCRVTGHWRNELGSVVQFSTVGSELRGVYQTAVEIANGTAGPKRNLTGFVSEGLQPTVAFSVLWNKGSCTSWVGQCFTLPDGTWELRTVWLLRSVAKKSGDNWSSTRLGADRFTILYEKPANEVPPNEVVKVLKVQ